MNKSVMKGSRKALARATTPNNVESDRYPEPHRSSVFYHDWVLRLDNVIIDKIKALQCSSRR